MRGGSADIADSLESIHYSLVATASGLGEGENPELNKASLPKASTGSNLLTSEFLQAVLSMVKVILLEGYSPFASKYGLHHCKDGVYRAFGLAVTDDPKRVAPKRSEIIRFKVKSDQPKGSTRIST